MTEEDKTNGDSVGMGTTLVQEDKPKKVKKEDPKKTEMKDILDEVSNNIKYGKYVKASEALSRAYKKLEEL